ncbi:MAG: SDR family oxidoreductase [Chloroflexota bacterium]|nr:MAG: SDR family oxidoreductase [Chloroflexota bacterium]
MLDLIGKVAIITGGGTGIGQGIALRLSQQGCKVVLNGRRRVPLDRTLQEISARGGECLAVAGDVSLEEDVARLLETTQNTFGQVDILINNAGIDGGGYIHDHDVQTWDQVLATNLRGPFLTARAVLPMMRERKQGHIINISSESGLEYYQGNGAYGVAKHALNALGEFIQRENQDFGIRVDTICPGMVVTEMTKESSGLDHSKCLYPEDIAELVLWLVTRRVNIKIGTPVLIQTMENPWH